MALVRHKPVNLLGQRLLRRARCVSTLQRPAQSPASPARYIARRVALELARTHPGALSWVHVGQWCEGRVRRFCRLAHVSMSMVRASMSVRPLALLRRDGHSNVLAEDTPER